MADVVVLLVPGRIIYRIRDIASTGVRTRMPACRVVADKQLLIVFQRLIDLGQHLIRCIWIRDLCLEDIAW